MITEKLQALFNFIDYLDKRKTELIGIYLPICEEIDHLIHQRSKLNPKTNYIEKQKYDQLQRQITEKFQPITQNIYTPTMQKLEDLKIWSGDTVFTSIWNNNSPAIQKFKEDFEPEDISSVLEYKEKYLNFRKETNSNFLCLQLVFHELDEVLKELFDFFKDTTESEFESFETKTVEVNSIKEAIMGSMANKGKNISFSIPSEVFFHQKKSNNPKPHIPNINNEIVMGNKIQVGDISNNSGQIIIGNNIKISESLDKKKEVANKISELIDIIRKQQEIDLGKRQTLITNFDKVQEELFEEEPSKKNIFKWLSKTKEVLESLVLGHEVMQAVEWIYLNLNFMPQD
jgi:hypothetical protein